jgi:hypothetical protein
MRLGATAGQDDTKALLARAAFTPESATVVIFDFAAVETVNASYLRATVLWLLRAGMHFVDLEEERTRTAIPGIPPLNVIPAVALVRDEVMDDLTTLLVSEELPLLLVRHANLPSDARCLGRLDPALRETLVALAKIRSATATVLCEQFPQRPAIKPPAWSNRLSELYRLRLVSREREGRQWRYASVVEEVQFG